MPTGIPIDVMLPKICFCKEEMRHIVTALFKNSLSISALFWYSFRKSTHCCWHCEDPSASSFKNSDMIFVKWCKHEVRMWCLKSKISSSLNCLPCSCLTCRQMVDFPDSAVPKSKTLTGKRFVLLSAGTTIEGRRTYIGITMLDDE